MFRFNRFIKYRWNKKYPEGYADLCGFIMDYLINLIMKIVYYIDIINLVFTYKGQIKIGLLLVLNKNGL